jgi:hypothetical protein
VFLIVLMLLLLLLLSYYSYSLPYCFFEECSEICCAWDSFAVNTNTAPLDADLAGNDSLLGVALPEIRELREEQRMTMLKSLLAFAFLKAIAFPPIFSFGEIAAAAVWETQTLWWCLCLWYSCLLYSA